MQLQLDIYKGVPGKCQHKVQEEYEALAQGDGGTLGPKRGLTTWVPNAKGS